MGRHDSVFKMIHSFGSTGPKSVDAGVGGGTRVRGQEARPTVKAALVDTVGATGVRMCANRGIA